MQNGGWKEFAHCNEDEYPKYDSYDAIEVIARAAYSDVFICQKK